MSPAASGFPYVQTRARTIKPRSTTIKTTPIAFMYLT
jgi:hypothetical protein